MALAIITGGSGGIGLDLASLFAADGYDLVLIARHETVLARACDDLARRHRIKAWPVAADLGVPSGVGEVVSRVKSLGRDGEVAALVNNAGFGHRGPFVKSNTDEQVGMINVNVTALTHLTRLLLPGMVERRRGMILNVASTAAFQPGPLMTVYYATKAYVLSFSVALAVELEGTGVTATCLCPGPTATGFQARAGMAGTALSSSMLAMDSAAVARAGYRAMKRGKKVVVPGLLNRLGAAGAKFAPRTMAARVAKLSQGARNG